MSFEKMLLHVFALTKQSEKESNGDPFVSSSTAM
jgi:hypothetical protein